MPLMIKGPVGRGLAAFVAYVLLFHFLKNIGGSNRVRTYLPSMPEVPSITFDYHKPLYNESKVALLIENRPQGMIAPMMLHMMSTLPPDWRFNFMGSTESVAHVNQSAAVRQQVKAGKLDLTYIPSNMSTAGQEMISRFLTNQWLYETVLAPAEWLLIYQTDSMMCGNAKSSLDDWLEYDWVGAPWSLDSRYGGNGGLSLRRVSSMIEVLRHQQRQNFSEPEDVWLTERLGHLPNSRTANGSESVKFSGEAHWYDYPQGYHTGGSGAWLVGGIWGTPEKRDHIYNYCPEMKLTLGMDLRSMYRSTCNTNW